MRRSDRAVLRRVQAALKDPAKCDLEARRLALVLVAGLLLDVEARRLVAELKADQREAG